MVQIKGKYSYVVVGLTVAFLFFAQQSSMSFLPAANAQETTGDVCGAAGWLVEGKSVCAEEQIVIVSADDGNDGSWTQYGDGSIGANPSATEVPISQGDSSKPNPNADSGSTERCSTGGRVLAEVGCEAGCISIEVACDLGCPVCGLGCHILTGACSMGCHEVIDKACSPPTVPTPPPVEQAENPQK
jgi:hypothetical protein